MKFLMLLSLVLIGYSPLAHAMTSEEWSDEFALEGDAVDPKVFFDSIQGDYKIQAVRGEKPSESDNTGNVTSTATEGDITLPYCQKGHVCDPGYLFFPLTNTKVKKKVVSGTEVIFTLMVEDAGKTAIYTWHNTNGSVTFVNLQYKLSPGHIIALEHVLSKI